MPTTILVVEDDTAIRRGLVDALQFAGYATIACEDGAEGMRTALSAAIDLAILDVVLPKASGLDVLKAIRATKPTLAVILVTARGAEADRVHGLKIGADDYIVKPFSAKEVLARVEAVLRRSGNRPLDVRTASVAGRAIDFQRREARLQDGRVSDLSEREAELLRYLLQCPDRVVSREELLQNVWGLDPKGVHTRTIDMHIVRLREKLGDDPDSPKVILTVRGKGYKLGELQQCS